MKGPAHRGAAHVSGCAHIARGGGVNTQVHHCGLAPSGRTKPRRRRVHRDPTLGLPREEPARIWENRHLQKGLSVSPHRRPAIGLTPKNGPRSYAIQPLPAQAACLVVIATGLNQNVVLVDRQTPSQQSPGANSRRASSSLKGEKTYQSFLGGAWEPWEGWEAGKGPWWTCSICRNQSLTLPCAASIEETWGIILSLLAPGSSHRKILAPLQK